jgi:hypothetical protein
LQYLLCKARETKRREISRYPDLLHVYTSITGHFSSLGCTIFDTITMGAYSYTLAQLLLFSAAVTALPELAITKHRAADVTAARLRRRDGGTVQTNVYDVLTWSTGGAYYANGECKLHNMRIDTSGQHWKRGIRFTR